MGLAQSALVLLGIGIVSSRFKAGVGLGELGTGISTLVAAPLVGTGTGLSTFAGGIRDLSSTLGDLGRGLGALFANIPKLPPPREGPPRHGTSDTGPEPAPTPSPPPKIWSATRPLITNASNDLAPGGGTRVPLPTSRPPQPTIYGPVLTQPVIISPTPTLPGYTPPPTARPITLIDNKLRPVMM